MKFTMKTAKGKTIVTLNGEKRFAFGTIRDALNFIFAIKNLT